MFEIGSPADFVEPVGSILASLGQNKTAPQGGRFILAETRIRTRLAGICLSVFYIFRCLPVPRILPQI